MIDIGLHLLQSNNLFQTLMFLVSDLFWECVRCVFFVLFFFGSLGEIFQGFGGEWPKSLMTLQCSVISGMTRDDILITKDRPISWKITNIAFMKMAKTHQLILFLYVFVALPTRMSWLGSFRWRFFFVSGRSAWSVSWCACGREP